MTVAKKIEDRILVVRDQRVMLDADLAELYGVETKELNRAVVRNSERFPEDFMFQLTNQEVIALRCHFGTSKSRGGRRYFPYAFTEQGVAMLSSVLKSKRAVRVNIEIMRTFVRLKQFSGVCSELSLKLDNLEMRYDAQFKIIFDAIRKLMEPLPEKSKRRIGFKVLKKNK